MIERTSIFADPLKEEFNVSDFTPKPHDTKRPTPAEIDQAAGTRFKSREASTENSDAASGQPVVEAPATRRQPMVYRTGRNVVFSAKTTAATVERFYFLAKQNGWKAGETFEYAVAALERQVDSGNS